MIHLDVNELKTKVTDMKQEVENKALESSIWLWVLGGAFTGLLASCLKLDSDKKGNK